MTKLFVAGLIAAAAVPALAEVAPPSTAPLPIAHGQSMTRADVSSRMAAMFARLDTNRDGVITEAEIAAAKQAMAANQPAGTDGGHHHSLRGMGAKMFERADANHDGRLTLAEAQAEAIAHFDMMDLNHDGVVSPEERQAARAAMMTNKGR